MEKIISILRDLRPEHDFVGVDDFFNKGMLDSFDLTQLLSAIEEKFGVSIDGAEIVPENFCNLEAIRSLLVRHGASA